MVLDTVAPRASLPDTAASHEDLLLLMQRRAADQRAGFQLPCPTCAAAAYGMDAEATLHVETLEAALTARGLRTASASRVCAS